MSSAALILVVIASSIHATWNLLTKRAGDRLAFLWLGLGAGLVLYLPAAVWVAINDPPDPRGYIFVLASGTIHAGYYYALSRMYRHDFSLTYPMARGSSPVIVTLFSLLVLREPLSAGGIAGIALVVFGIMSLQIRKDATGRWRWPLVQAFRGEAGSAAMFTALMIASYSLIDKHGVAYINPVLYLWISHLVAFLGYSAFMLSQRDKVIAEWRRSPRSVVIVAIGQNLAYIMVLFAMRLAPVAYVVPAREMSTLIGASLGVILLREPFPLAKIAGAGFIVAGVVLIALLG